MTQDEKFALIEGNIIPKPLSGVTQVAVQELLS
jgi:hypothetical protein